MKNNIKEFDFALACAYGADLWAKTYYWSNLIKVYHSLQKDDIPKAASLMNIFIDNLSFEDKIKFFRIVENAK